MFYITTAIDYTNGAPHLGHAYEKVLADVIARYQRLKGEEVYFLTGVDQHGQKVQQKAEEAGINPATFATKTTKLFLNLWKKLGVQYDGWAETMDERHKACVQAILTDLNERGELYKKSYKGFYSVKQEQFLTDRDRNEAGEFGPEWGQVEERDEENWYFRLSAHAEWLKGFVEKHPDFVTPAIRRNELVGALANSGELDLCISRPKERLRWGIEFPFDPDFVTYVWFDALINYISFAGYRAKEGSGLPDFKKLWPCAAHVIGKDILVPAHGVYWPCMLHAMGFADE
jgi:methionyl-tRNA synthetase